MILDIESKNEEIFEKMIRLISEGRRDEFMNLFSSVRLKRVAKSIFTHVTKTNVVKDSIPQIVFHDDEYIVVVSHVGYTANKNPFPGIWVLGKEDNMLWIHRASEGSVESLIEDITFEPASKIGQPMKVGIKDVTKERVKKEMLGYDYDYKTNPHFEVGKRVRVQGDLTCERTHVVDEKLINENLQENIGLCRGYVPDSYSDAVESEMRERILKEKPLLREEVADYSRFRNTRRNRRGVAKNTEELAYLHHDFPGGGFYQYTVSPPGYLTRLVESAVQEYVNSEEGKQRLQNELLEAEGRARSEMAALLSDENQMQTTARVSNHMIVVEKALKRKLEPHTAQHIEIMRKTTAFLIHDEHGTSKIELEPGFYEFRLLPRHELG